VKRDLQAVLRAMDEICRCVADQRNDKSLGGPFLGEMDWRWELSNLLFPKGRLSMDGPIVKSASGATSTKLEESWHLIPFAALSAMARRFFEGSQKHAPRNWEKGDAEFAEIRLAHCFRHMARYAEYRKQEDLDAVLANAAMLAYFAAKGLLPERVVKP